MRQWVAAVAGVAACQGFKFLTDSRTSSNRNCARGSGLESPLGKHDPLVKSGGRRAWLPTCHRGGASASCFHSGGPCVGLDLRAIGDMEGPPISGPRPTRACRTLPIEDPEFKLGSSDLCPPTTTSQPKEAPHPRASRLALISGPSA
eukprot:Polyplicarium_translucidae@DN2477_c0_g1_i2.p1